MRKVDLYPARMYFTVLPLLPAALVIDGQIILGAAGLGIVLALMWIDPLVRTFTTSKSHRRFLLAGSLSGFALGVGFAMGVVGLWLMLSWCLAMLIAALTLPFPFPEPVQRKE